MGHNWEHDLKQYIFQLLKNFAKAQNVLTIRVFDLFVIVYSGI